MAQVAWAYKRVFGSPDGKAILDDLERAFGLNMSTAMPTATRPGQPLAYDPYYTHIRSGQRDVYLHIKHQMNLDLAPEGNLTRANVEPFETVPRDF